MRKKEFLSQLEEAHKDGLLSAQTRGVWTEYRVKRATFVWVSPACTINAISKGDGFEVTAAGNFSYRRGRINVGSTCSEIKAMGFV